MFHLPIPLHPSLSIPSHPPFRPPTCVSSTSSCLDNLLPCCILPLRKCCSQSPPQPLRLLIVVHCSIAHLTQQPGYILRLARFLHRLNNKKVGRVVITIASSAYNSKLTWRPHDLACSSTGPRQIPAAHQYQLWEGYQLTAETSCSCGRGMGKGTDNACSFPFKSAYRVPPRTA